MSHAGKITNPKSKAGRLYRVLQRRPGRFFTTLELAMALDDPCVHTTVYEVRGQLPAELALVCRRVPVRGPRSGLVRRYAYALVAVGEEETAAASMATAKSIPTARWGRKGQRRRLWRRRSQYQQH